MTRKEYTPIWYCLKIWSPIRWLIIIFPVKITITKRYIGISHQTDSNTLTACLDAFHSCPSHPSDICQLNLVGQQLTHHLLTSAWMLPGIVGWLSQQGTSAGHLDGFLQTNGDTMRYPKIVNCGRHDDDKY